LHLLLKRQVCPSEISTRTAPKAKLLTDNNLTFCYLSEERMELDLKLNKASKMTTDSVHYMATS